jgi:hypothetical protein
MGKAGGKLIKKFVPEGSNRVTFVHARVAFSLILQTCPCKNAKYIKIGHDIRDTMKDTGRLWNNSIYHFTATK